MSEKKYPFNNSDSEWKENLSELEYHVLRNKGTEAPYKVRIQILLTQASITAKDVMCNYFHQSRNFNLLVAGQVLITSWNQQILSRFKTILWECAEPK